MVARRARKPRPPLDPASLKELALTYVGRFATTRGKLRDYLRRKLRERGWNGESEPDVESLAERFAEQGYIDDGGYALAKSRSLVGRGYGVRRVRQSLQSAGIEESDLDDALGHAESEAVASALRFAERRRIGPFASAPPRDRAEFEKALAAMVRAGHSFALARAIVELEPAAEIDFDELADKSGFTR